MASPVAATVSSSGITAPTYAQVLAYLISQYQAIFGADAYLGNDSLDGQLLGIYAQAISDCNSAAVAVFNSFSPATAQGNGLSSNVKLNGLTRLPGSFSVATITCVGVAQTTISNGVVKDTNGDLWSLPASVTIPQAGTIDVLATCQTLGAIAAAANTINQIQTPVFGWQTANNANPATVGSPVETDAALRVRQANSTAAPAQTVFDGIVANIAAVPGVTRIAAYENNTNSADGNGVPAGNLAFVVESNVVDNSIAVAIASRIPPGVPTYRTGTGFTWTIIDAQGFSKVINYMAPTESRIDIVLTIHGLNGWSTSTESIIQQALIAYLASLPIGQPVSYSGLFLPAYLQKTAYAGTFRITAMTIAKNEGSPQTSDLSMAFNEAPFSDVNHITFVIV